jgi:hypothetical protein
MVGVTHVDGVAVAQSSTGGRRTVLRRALSDANSSNVAITFAVQSASNSTDQVEALKASMAEAASEGSIVANVQKEASANGVLTPALLAMNRTLPAPVMTQVGHLPIY